MNQNQSPKSRYIAICAEEFKEVLAQELQSEGAEEVTLGFKAVHFIASAKNAYKIHLKNATSSRIMQLLREGKAKDAKAVFFQALKIKWPEVIGSKTTYLVEGIAGDRGDDAPTSNILSRTIREALEASFDHVKVERPKVDLKDPQVIIVGYYHNRTISISVVTSGKSMHKRGYKTERHPAPIKEHLAASLLHMAGYDGSQVLFDPMCGSGTFVIEGAYIALNKGALIHRRKGEFGLEHMKTFDKDLFRLTQDEVRQGKKDAPPQPIFAADIEPRYLEMTQRHALKARVERHIQLSEQDFFKAPAPASKGILAVNLPYGERLTEGDLEAFYKRFGDKLKQSYSGWTCAVVAAEGSPWKQIGLRPHSRRQLENGGIPCRFLLYRLYDGSLKQRPGRETTEEQVPPL